MKTTTTIIFCCLIIGWIIILLIRKNSKSDHKSNTELTQRDLNILEEYKHKCDQRTQRIAGIQESLQSRLSEIINLHISTLQKKQRQTIHYDDYGVICGVDKWEQEVSYFRDNVICRDPAVGAIADQIMSEGVPKIKEDNSIPSMKLLFDDGLSDLRLLIDTAIYQQCQNLTSENEVDGMSGQDYELLCAGALEQDGWRIVLKGRTGDQGVDLIARLGNLSVAVQCKRYSQPVGNKAVQEVASGRQFEQCHLAAVVSNADFTKSARQLAGALGVLLLHHSELPTFRQRIENQYSELIEGEAAA